MGSQRLGNTADWELLCSRNIHYHDITNLLNTPVRLAYTSEDFAKQNYEMLRKQNRTIYSIKALNNNSKLSKISSNELGRLEPIVNQAVVSRIMLLQNLWIDKSLCNGAMR